MKKSAILIYFLITVVFLFLHPVLGQTTQKTGSLLNKRYPAVEFKSAPKGQGGVRAPLQSISVNEDPAFNALTPTELVQQAFITGCLKADNIKFGYYKKSGMNWIWVDHTWASPNNRQMGYFKKGSSSFPIEEGIILSTGIAASAMGPNNTEGKSDLMVAGASDPDLSMLAGQDMNDAAILEFDFVPAGNTMEFKYTFSSEEYLEYINSTFNDAFGFFLSGPGINGTYQNNAVNLAILPNGDPVTINTIHPAGTNIGGQSYPAQNDAYYVNNPQGSSTFQFDGGTVVLTARYAVTPCQIYHIKLSVADAYDQEFDNAVFLAAKSFNSENVILTNFGNLIEGLNDVFEGCSDHFRVERSSSDLSQALDLDLVFSGTATNGIDIQTSGNQPFPNHITIPANSSFIDIPYYAVADGIPDNAETFDIKIATSCPCAINVVYVEKSLKIYENFTLNSIVATDALCYNQHNGTVTVNTSGGTGNFEYSKNNGLNWQRTNVFSGLAPGTYTILVRDPGSCYSILSGNAIVGNPAAIIANAGSQVTMCSGQSTQLIGSGGVLYTWLPVTGLSDATIANPIANPSTTTTYTLKATNSTGQCASTSTVTIIVNPSPVAVINQLNLEICKGSNTTLTASGGDSYSWNPGGETTSSIIVSPLVNTSYTVSVMKNNGCSVTKTASVAVLDSPDIFNITGGGSFCSGSTGVAVGLSNSQNGVNYQLKLNGSSIGSAIPGNGAAISFGNQTLSGNYTAEAIMTATACINPMNGNAIVIANSVPTSPVAGIITQPTCTVATGSVILSGLPAGNWTINPGTIAGSGSTVTISGLVAGTYAYTVTNAVGCTSPASANIVINLQPVTPSAPNLISIIQPTCLIATGSKTLGGLPIGNWILNPGAIAGTGTTKTISGLSAGSYAFTVTNAAGCTSIPSSNFTINTQPPTPSAPTVGTITQPTCLVPTGSVALNNLPTGSWTINPGAISGSGTSYTILGLVSGTYSYTVTNATGCTSVASSNVVIVSAIPPTPIIGTITQPTCTIATGNIILNGLPSGNWTINPGAINGTGNNYTITGLAAGTYSYTVTNSIGCVSSPSANFNINAQPVTPSAPTVGTITHPTCTMSTGSVTLNNLPSGNWTINPGAISGSGLSRTISGIAAGTYTFTVTNESGCISAASANVVINAQPSIPTAPVASTITQTTCSVSTGSVILTGLPSGNWILNPGAIAGNTASTTITGLAAGTYNYTVTLGCTSASSANVVINIQPLTPSAPIVGTITQPTCSVSTGSAVLSGLPADNWIINPGAKAGSGASTTLSGLAAGNHSYSVTNAAGCTSPLSINIVIDLQPVIPSAPVIGAITQPTCSAATGIVVLSGLPSGNWVINPGAIAGTGASYTMSGLIPGTYTYIVTNDAGCSSSASGSIVINTQPVTPSAPIAGAITQPTCFLATGSVVLNGLPTGNWSINPGAIAGTGASKALSGLTSGTYNYAVTNAAGCTSPVSANIIINVNPATPSAPTINSVTQPNCSVATGSVVLGGLPASSWTINPGAISGSGSTKTISNLIPGTYNYSVTNAAGCTSLLTANIVITANPGTPAAPIVGTITQPSCSVATGSVVLTGLPSGTWTIDPGAISGSGSSTTITGLATGTYTFTVSNGVGCISLSTVEIVIDVQPPTPLAPILGTITQPTCAVSTGSVVLNGLPAGNWIINPGAIAGSGASKTITGIAAGTYAFTVTNSVGCTSPPTANVVITAATPAAPIIGSITQTTCSVSTGSAVLNGLPAGNWIINPGAIAGTGLSTTISNLAAGTRSFTVTNSLGCTSLASASVVINAQPVTPSVPVVGAITQPTCSVATGSVVLSGLPSGSWIINPGAIAGTGTSYTIGSLATATHNFTVTNAAGCTSLASANVGISSQPITPSAPVISSVTQPTCAVATGSVNLAGLPAGNWTINPGAISGSGTSTTLSGLIAGTYNYSVTNSAGCTSLASADAVIIANPGTPASPSVGSVTQPTCSVATGSIQLNGLPAGNWIVNPGNIAGTGVTTIVSGVLPGTYNYNVINGSGCVSLPSSSVVINTQPVTPSAPTVSSVTQPICSLATGSALLIGLPTGNWTINPGAFAGTGISKSISGLGAGTYTFTVTNSAGCTSIASANAVINPQPVTPATPTVGIITQPTCSVATGSAILGGLPTGNWIINPGSIAGTGANTTISGLSAGTRTFTVTNSVGCISSASTSVVINTQPVTPLAPSVGTITQPSCTLATGSVVLNGLPSGAWTINPGSINGNTTSTTISGLVSGTYNYAITNAAGCTSSASANIIINTQPLTPSAPIAGIITQPTCSVATGSAELSGLPLGNWTINPEAITGTGITKTVTGLTAGIKSFTVTNESGCSSPASANVTIDAQPVTPSAPAISTVTQPTCSISTGSVVLSGLPSGNWTINPGAITGNTSSTIISGLIAGSYNYSVTNSAGCTSAPTANIVINAQPLTPSVPNIGTITQANCLSATGSVLLSGLPSGNWIINPGAIAGTGISTTISGLTPGTHSYTVTNASGCTSVNSDEVIINTQPITPSAPVLTINSQPSCSISTGSIAISGLPAGNWTINPGAITGTGASVTLPGVTAGTYSYNVTNQAGCVSLASANAVINKQPVTPTPPSIGTVTQPTCGVATGSIILNDLPTGNWTINPGVITGSGTSKTISGLDAGTYSYSVTNSSGCTSLPSSSIEIHIQPVTPVAPLPGTVTQPNCFTATGTVQVNGLPADTWIINPGNHTGTGISTLITGLNTGTYNFSVTNLAGCVSLPSSDIVINIQPVTPAAPKAGTILQPECTVPGGIAELTGLPVGNWTINPGAITGTGLNTTLSNLTTGTYTYTVTNDVGCTSLLSENIVINSSPLVPSAPIAGLITQPTCGISKGSVTLTGLPLRNWVINPGGILGNTSSVTIPGLSAGTYTFTVSKVDGCTSLPSANVIINAQPATPPAPTIATITQPSCVGSTGSITITAPSGPGITYSINGSTYSNTSGLFTLLSSGPYQVTAKTPDGCISSATNAIINNPPADIIYTVQQVTKVSCSGGNDGRIKISASGGTGTITYSINPNTGIQTPVGTFNNLVDQTYTITATDGNGCTKLISIAVGTTIDVTPPIITCPINITITTNTGCTATGVALGIPITSDNCGVASVTNNAPAMFPLGATTVIWTVTDNSGNKATCNQTVTVTDNILPTITSPANINTTTNTGCTFTGVALGTPVTSDNCGVASITNDAPAAFPLGTTIITWTVTDNSGNKKSSSQTVTVADNIPPTIVCPANVTATTNTGCTATGVVLATPTTSDNCGVASVTNNAPAVFPLGATSVIWTVTDNSGNKATCNQTVTVSDNVLPTITCPINVTATTKAGCSATGVTLGTPVTSDNCGVASVTNNAPLAFPLGATTVIWTVTDNSGNKATCNQTVTVTDNVLPNISCPANVTAYTNTGCSATGVSLGTPVTSDNCGVALVTNNAPLAFPLGTTTVTWTVVDNSGNKATCNQTVTVSDNKPPSIVCPAPVSVIADAGFSYATAVNLGAPITSDNCGVASVINDAPVQFPIGSTTVTWTVSDVNGLSATCSQIAFVTDSQSPVMNCPTSVTVSCINEVPAPYSSLEEYINAGGTVADNDGIDNSSFSLSSQTSNGGTCPEVITRIYTVSDVNHNFGACSQSIIVDDKTAPVFANFPADITVQCTNVPSNAVIGTDVTATDNCDPSVTITFENEQRTDGTCAGTYTLTRTWKAADICGNNTIKSQTIQVQDVAAPIISALPSETTINCPASPVFALATAIDDCGSDFKLAFEDVTTQEACSGSYSITRTWTATDSCGNTSKASQTIKVQDVTAPVIAALPAETTINCPAIPEFAVATATDECGIDITLIFADITTPGACAGSYSVTRTWTATDACGNASVASQTINVQDNTAPMISTLPAETTINCPTGPVFAVATAIDTCGSDFKLTFDDFSTPGACAGSYSVTRIWTATDSCGNISTASQTIHVQDTTALLITCPSSITVNNDPGICGATIVVPQPEIIEDCGTTSITNSMNNTADASGLYPVGISTVLWTVTDECGNTSTCSMTITVADNESPVLTCPANIVICETAQVLLGIATATDNCSIANISNNAPATFNAGITEVIWTATDLHGNISTCTQTVTVTTKVTVNAGDDKPVCYNMPFSFTEASATNFSVVSWSHNGQGSLSGGEVLNPVYTPAPGEEGSVEFKLSAYGTSGCSNMVIHDMVTLTIYPAIKVDAGTDKIIISGTSTELNGTASGGSNVLAYSWQPESYLVDNTEQNPKTLPLNAETLFTLTAIDAISGCSQSDQVTITVDGIRRPIANDDHDTTGLNTPVIVNVTENDTDIIGLGLDVSIVHNPANGIVNLNEDGFITYTPRFNFTGNDTITYMICDRGTPSKCDTALVIITIFPVREELEIYNLVTPDGDGKNDYWRIGGIENHPDNEVLIFNRWGTKVREFIGYDNADKRWNGTNDMDEYLPDGVYYYILKVKELKTYTGWIYIRGTRHN